VGFFGLFGKNRETEPRSIDAKEQRRIDVTNALQQRSIDIASGFEEIRRNQLFQRHVLALSNAVSTAVGAICFNEMRYGDEAPLYADIWTRTDEIFADLASFLSYQFVILELPSDDPNRDTLTAELLGLAATVYPASERAYGLIERYGELMEDPDELRRRCILGLFAGSDDDEARGVVFAFIVNEAIEGPPLELDVSDEGLANNRARIDPAYSLWLRMRLSLLQLELIKAYRKDTVLKKNVSREEYLRAANIAMATATEKVKAIFG